MSFRKSKSAEGALITSAAPGWVGWLFFLIGTCFLTVVYFGEFQPQWNANGLRLFADPADKDLWAGMAIVVTVFTGGGAAILAHRTTWLSRQWVPTLKHSFPDDPWMWRQDWSDRRIRPDQPTGWHYIFAYAVLCLLAAVPGLEYWIHRGGRPDHLAIYAAVGAAAMGTLVLSVMVYRTLKRVAAPRSLFHLANDTGTVGGPLLGAIEYPVSTDSGEILVRLVCERHWIRISKTSDGTSRSHEVSTEYEDTYRAVPQNGLIPVRFAIPFEKPPTTTDWNTPVFLWFVELEDTDGKKSDRFWTPVFRTPESSADFELGGASADKLIEEETPAEVLTRHGISVSHNESLRTVGQTLISVPPCRAPSHAAVISVFGIVMLIAAGFLFQIEYAGVLFGGVFGLFGLLLTAIGFQLLFERRLIEIDSHEIRVRCSYFGFGWTRSLPWDAVNSLKTTFSGSTSGRRHRYDNVVAMTDGIKRKDGSMISRRWSIINSVPSEAADAASTLMESIATMSDNSTQAD